MAKLEKVIKGLECCGSLMDCAPCPYDGEDNGCFTILKGDALELLREREPVKPIDETYWNHTYGRCGHCRAPLPALEGLKSKFCWMCGKAVKWNEPD